MRNIMRDIAIAIGAAAIVFFLYAVYTMALAGQASADPLQDNAKMACEQLGLQSDAHTGITDQGITNVIGSMFKAGISPEEGGDILAEATNKYCPGFQDALISYFDELDAGLFWIDDNYKVHYYARQMA